MAAERKPEELLAGKTAVQEILEPNEFLETKEEICPLDPTGMAPEYAETTV